MGQAEDERVRLDVGFVDDVHAQLVAQVVEARVVGGVRRAHRVESELLHQHQVGAHLLDGDDAAGHRIEVVTVDTAEQHGPAVDEELALVDLDAPEADPQRRRLPHTTLGIEQLDPQAIQGRDLG